MLPKWIQNTRVNGSSAGQDGGAAPSVPYVGNPQLGFTMQSQDATQWCWAAVTVSVVKFYQPGAGMTQCQIAQKVLCKADCCTDMSVCDTPYVVYHPLGAVGHLEEVRAGPIQLQGVPNELSIQREVDSGRPIVCRIGWSGGGGHFIVLYGYDLSGPTGYVHVADSENGNSVYTLPALQSGYKNGSGTWTHTYTTSA